MSGLTIARAKTPWMAAACLSAECITNCSTETLPNKTWRDSQFDSSVQRGRRIVRKTGIYSLEQTSKYDADGVGIVLHKEKCGDLFEWTTYWTDMDVSSTGHIATYYCSKRGRNEIFVRNINGKEQRISLKNRQRYFRIKIDASFTFVVCSAGNHAMLFNLQTGDEIRIEGFNSTALFLETQPVLVMRKLYYSHLLLTGYHLKTGVLKTELIIKTIKYPVKRPRIIEDLRLMPCATFLCATPHSDNPALRVLGLLPMDLRMAVVTCAFNYNQLITAKDLKEVEQTFDTFVSFELPSRKRQRK